jgi:hypothetical protein
MGDVLAYLTAGQELLLPTAPPTLSIGVQRVRIVTVRRKSQLIEIRRYRASAGEWDTVTEWWPWQSFLRALKRARDRKKELLPILHRDFVDAALAIYAP